MSMRVAFISTLAVIVIGIGYFIAIGLLHY
jgi:hypothetical protein